MSATVIARSYNDSPQHHQFMVASGGLESRPGTLKAPATAFGGPRNSSLRRERPRVSGGGMRISFASDTRFVERSLRSRSSSRSAATSYNLRPVQGTERPIKAKVRLPKATAATGFKNTSALEDDYLNPRKAMDIAKSYGIPKYFLRGNTQVLTDGRMRLFGDNVWKKERASLDSDRLTKDSSDVINRLMDSVDKAIATSRKVPPTSDDESTIKLEIISLKSGADERASLRGSVRSLQGAANTEISSASGDGHKDGATIMSAAAAVSDIDIDGGSRHANFGRPAWGTSGNEENVGMTFNDLRPHTVDTTAGTLVRYLPKMLQKDIDRRDSANFDQSRCGFFSGPQFQSPGGLRSTQATVSPFRGLSVVSGSAMSQHRGKSLDDKYHNVLPRFYPAVSAHRSRQAEAEKTGSRSSKKKSGGHQRLVRFADTHTVRFPNDLASLQEPIGSLVAQRAPIQSVQRSLHSHSGLSQAEKYKRQKEIIEIAENNAE